MKAATIAGVLAIGAASCGAEPAGEATPGPYAGPSVHAVDTSTLTGKVMCGYQGWFNCAGDGAQRGWVHWTKGAGPPSPGNVKVDLWPDVSELGAAERFDTEFKHTDGRVAQVFSSFNKATVLRHFQWMRDYGLDGAFVQRFVSGLRNPGTLRHNNAVLAHCREGANRNGRAYALMYDLSGLRGGRAAEVINDWRELRTRMRLTEDPAYLHHRGRPLVAVWGVGFGDKRAYTLGDCRQIVEFLKQDGCAVMLGVPTGWRDLNRDAVRDPELHKVIQLADVISPWTVGRYRDAAGAARLAEKTWQPDIAWCAGRQLDFLPVVFPGFSWFNMYGGPFDPIPRRKGEFLWAQFVAAKRAGATMIYVAMFDEVDEGTAIFKCTNDTPVGGTAKLIDYEGLPSDYYLRLAGAGAQLLRSKQPLSAVMPNPIKP